MHRAVDEYERLARLGEELPLVSPSVMVDRVLRSITDFGPMTDLIARRDVEEIFLEGATRVVPRRVRVTCGDSPCRRARRRAGR